MASITETLWRQAKAGDEAAYGRLFALHADRALLFIRARLGPHLRNTIESGDVLQEAYLAAHRGFDAFTYQDDGSFFRWLCRIIENRIRDWNDYTRAEKRQAAPLPASDPTGPITALDRKLDRQRLLAALDRLIEDHRVVLLLRYFEGLSSEEAGARMQRSAGAVRKLTARALAELGKAMKADSPQPGKANGHESRRPD
jgi:RNA polymerase sigma-70 factor (ECF subfamily)